MAPAPPPTARISPSAPGFINLHSHATPEGVATAANMLTQGVTTEIINADGGGGIDIPKQVAYFSAKGLAVNLGTYIGFNSIWGSVVGQSDRRPMPDEIGKMREILTANLILGIWDVSAGLDYKPGYFARTEEVIAILEAARHWRTNFPNHDRLTPESRFSSLAGIAETIAIGEQSGLIPVITHMRAVAAMRAASTRGYESTADIYPYLAGATGLGSLFVPAWAVSGGREEMLKRFRNPELRARIALEIEEAIAARILTPENIGIPSKQRSFVSYMQERKAGAEPDLAELLRHPNVAVSCDCGAIEPTERPGVHPRYFGTFPRVLGHYARNTKALTLEDAERKMAGLPANMPSRPQVAGANPSLTVANPTVSASITGKQGAFRFSDPRTKTAIRLVRAGKVQAYGQWASFTGVARVSPDNHDHAILVIFDGPFKHD